MKKINTDTLRRLIAEELGHQAFDAPDPSNKFSAAKGVDPEALGRNAMSRLDTAASDIMVAARNIGTPEVLDAAKKLLDHIRVLDDAIEASVGNRIQEAHRTYGHAHAPEVGLTLFRDDGSEVEVEVNGTVDPPEPGNRRGHPDTWEPAYGAAPEIISVMTDAGADIVDSLTDKEREQIERALIDRAEGDAEDALIDRWRSERDDW